MNTPSAMALSIRREGTVNGVSRVLSTLDDEQAIRARSSGVLIASVCALVVPAWGGFDHLLEPALARSFITLRLACEIPILALLWLLWARPIGLRRPQLLSLLVLGVVQGEIAWMVVRADSQRDIYLLGFSLALYGSGCLMSGRHRWTLAVVAVTWLALGAAMLTSPTPMSPRDLGAATFYLSTASLIGLIGHIQRERLSARELAARQRLEQEQDLAHALMTRLERLSNEDPLTGLANRRRWETQLGSACTRAAETGSSLAVLLIDIDHFKDINDRHGHSGGDDALRDVASLLADRVHGINLVARLGGDEYGVLLCDTDAAKATAVADTIRRDTSLLKPLAWGELTLSLGVAAAAGIEAEPDGLMRRADAQLYRAKSKRNAVAA
jgi:diguanylate cyclase (GGDEF)-like protein